MYDKATNTTLSQDLVSQLCKMILEGKIKKGEMLPSESKLCELFGVSRTTVRRALQVLAEQKIIRTERGRGSTVISDDFTYLNDGLRAKIRQYEGNFRYAVQVRRMLEPQIAHEAALSATAQDIDDLTAILELCRARHADGALTTADLRLFHLRLADTMQNPVLVSMIELLISLCDSPPETQMQVPNPSELAKPGVIEEHQAILDAIKDHSPEDAYFLMRKNIGTFKYNCLNEF
ncbi:MAG: FCD domain-containing protein [Oscillospiraceae bacterium]|nr:FCD domain-containing protein [Oscillospiraceae bacterium]MCD8192024.1 FCD domain-containing protein [Oscillospiraceae bacterium]